MLPVCAATFQVYPECPRINSLIWPTHFMLQEDHLLKNEEGTGVLLKIKKSHKLLRITSKHINVERATMPETSPEEDTYHHIWVRKKCGRIFVIEERKNVFPYALGQSTNIFSIIAFRTPYTDTCSICKTGMLNIKREENLEKKNQFRAMHRLHKLHAKIFYSIMKQEDPNVLKVCFDIQQNQPIPKLSVNEVFYSGQVWLYNLCVLVH